jgi:hypothetical protein
MLMHVGFSFGFFSRIARPTAISDPRSNRGAERAVS